MAPRGGDEPPSVGKAIIISKVSRIMRNMAKSDSFFIRAAVLQSGASFTQEEIDLGSFVNLGVKSSTLIRIHNIAVQIAAQSEEMKGPIAAGSILNVGWNLTTQSQTDLVHAFDKSVIAAGRYEIAANATLSSANTGLFAQDTRDVMPQDWKNGYLVGVDTLYLATEADQVSDNSPYYVTIVMECTLENATQASATALALSQQ